MSEASFSAKSAFRGRGRARRRGLLDAALMAVLVYAVYAKTPLGAIVETGVHMARGQKARPSWLATFTGRETAVQMSDAAVDAATSRQGPLPAVVTAAAAAHDVDVDALMALLGDDCTDTACEMDAPPRASAALATLADKARLTPDDAARALAAAKRELTASLGQADVELAIEALWLGPIPVRLAVEQARQSGLGEPGDVEAHADLLSPSLRRGPLQEALAVLAVYRLRTLAWPAERRFAVTSPFGGRIHPVTGKASFHNGTDIGTPVGTRLFAAHHGGVKRQSRDSLSGNYVVLDHGLGIETVYAHLREASVVEGERVRRKDVVGRSGSSGRVTGPHLHFILRVKGRPVDAERYGERASGVDLP